MEGGIMADKDVRPLDPPSTWSQRVYAIAPWPERDYAITSGPTVQLLERRGFGVQRKAPSGRMITDVQLAIFANMLGVSLFLLVVLYHYVAVNNPKKLE
ncbi:hypothetical protein scyTo_0013628 [Scyliorhinus torazame]|uniref:Dolichyl-diphosphooligosaccharide--protein glycosyltransferase subunit 4 n=2 Tax=Gnathostomata TaxID=7776 RepID=A0A401P152_SCYTO|nr:hypothetical protein [Scyliorhinus torazame]